MNQDLGKRDRPDKLGATPYVFGGLSYIPLIGVLFGVVVIVWGIATPKRGRRKLALIGLGGIALTVFLYGGLFYAGFIQKGGFFDGLRAQMAQINITSLVQSIELHKVRHGAYPPSLEDLRDALPEHAWVFVRDPTTGGFGGQSRYFHYQRVGEAHYYLLGLGVDGEPFTPDDILPQLTPGPTDGIGLLIKEQ